jgi:2-oxopent-4-enoate/cis-2-oxohex-4-enoate hydratase
LGDELYEALRSQSTLSPLTEREDDITIEDAYYISLRMVNRRVEDDGEIIVGKKIGVTSKPVQEMLGVFQPDFGFLTNKMEYPNGASIPIAGNLIAPRAEAEIAFVLKDDLKGDNITEADVLAATECIVPCFEIVDSRIRNWEIKIQDTVADNASCGVYVLGENRVSPQGLDLPNLKIRVEKNGEFLSEGLGSAVQGNPLTAVAWLANTLGKFNIPFNAGDVILSGSLVPLEPVVAGDSLTMVLEGIGECTVSFS